MIPEFILAPFDPGEIDGPQLIAAVFGDLSRIVQKRLILRVSRSREYYRDLFLHGPGPLLLGYCGPGAMGI